VLAEADLLVLGEGVAGDVTVLARRDAPRRALAQIDAAALVREAREGRQSAVIAGSEALTALAVALGADAPHHWLASAPGA
jgi:hypothetical protein